MATLACQRAGLLRAPALAPRSVAVRVGAPGARLPSQFVGRPASAAPVLPKLASRVVARKPLQVCNSAAGAPATPAPFKWGANMKDLAICIGLGVAVYLCPAPAGVSGWVRQNAKSMGCALQSQRYVQRMRNVFMQQRCTPSIWGRRSSTC
jgi:hypothetical protein